MRGILRYAAYGALAVGGAALCYYGYRRFYCGSKIADTTPTKVESVEKIETSQVSASAISLVESTTELHEDDKSTSPVSSSTQTPVKKISECQVAPDNDLARAMEAQDQLGEYTEEEYKAAQEFNVEMEALACYLFYQGRTDEELKQFELQLGPVWPVVMAYKDRVSLDNPAVGILNKE